MNRDLFLAVLAMDSYNRGYSPGIVYEGNQIGEATAASDELLPAGSQDESFYAVACCRFRGRLVKLARLSFRTQWG